MSALDELVKLTGNRKLVDELDQLRRHEDELWRHLPFKVGDRVAIVDQFNVENTGPGWQHYREILIPGAPGEVRAVHDWCGRWSADVRFEAEWSVHTDGKAVRRYGHDANRGLFGFRFKWLRLAVSTDVAPAMPQPSEPSTP